MEMLGAGQVIFKPSYGPFTSVPDSTKYDTQYTMRRGGGRILV
jgi:hypothetical protein